MAKLFLVTHCITGSVLATVLVIGLSLVQRQVSSVSDLIPVTVVLAYLAALPPALVLCRRRQGPRGRPLRGNGFTMP